MQSIKKNKRKMSLTERQRNLLHPLHEWCRLSETDTSPIHQYHNVQAEYHPRMLPL